MLCLLPASSAGEPLALSPQQQLDLLAQANSAFARALERAEVAAAQDHYQRALTSYEQLLAAGIENAKLYYNVGNIYFHLNDLGRAIANYRRGLRLEPSNPRLQANLRYALSLRVDKIEPSHRASMLPQILFWHDALPLGTQFSLAVGSFVLAWACALVRLFWQRPVLGWLLGGLVCCCVLLSSSALFVHLQHTTRQHGVIVSDGVEVRKGNGESYALQLSQPLHRGTEFVVQEERGAWLALRLDNGVSGWIRREQAVLW
jgi:tetratricopeptide (TPR) repeat protein